MNLETIVLLSSVCFTGFVAATAVFCDLYKRSREEEEEEFPEGAHGVHDHIEEYPTHDRWNHL